MPRKISTTVNQGYRRLVTGLGGLRAVVESTDYGASVELSDGRGSAFWAYAISGSALDAAVSWARVEGAVAVRVVS